MPYADGWAAVNMRMPERVPRTEFSAAEYHWPLIKRVTGIDVSADSGADAKRGATEAMRRAWTYDFNWNTPVGSNVLGRRQTSMGHAAYAEGGGDFRADISCPFASPEEALAFDPWEEYGEARGAKAFIAANYGASVKLRPDEVNMTGTYVSAMSGMIAIFGWDMLLLACGTDPRAFGEVVNRYAGWLNQYYEAIAESDIPIAMLHDDMVWTSGAFIHPDWYRKYIFPNYRKYIAPLLEAGKKAYFTSDGDYTRFIPDLVGCGFTGFVMEPLTDMRSFAERYGKTHSFIGNADTRILLSGSEGDIRAEVGRCMDIGKGCPGFFMAVGNHIPANTPVEACLIYEDEYRKRSRR